MQQQKKNVVPSLQAPGGEIPALGLGTWSLKGEEGIRAIQDALEIGYRHIDTAEIYDTEREVPSQGILHRLHYLTPMLSRISRKPDRYRGQSRYDRHGTDGLLPYSPESLDSKHSAGETGKAGTYWQFPWHSDAKKKSTCPSGSTDIIAYR